MSNNGELWLLEFANKASKIPFVKPLLKPIYYPIKKWIQNRRNTTFRKNALHVLDLFNQCCEENSINYTLAFGTLLGAIREKGFIKHDLDIDVNIWHSEYSDKIPKSLKKYGFKLSHTFLVDDGNLGREETYTLDGVSIDIFYLYERADSLPYCCDFISYNGSPTHRKSMELYGKVLARRIELPIGKEYEKVPFESLMLNAPNNANEILAYRYGSDYMTPNPNWGIRSYDNHIIEWHDKAGIYIEHDNNV